MAENEEPAGDNTEQGKGAGTRKKGIVLGGGMVGLVGIAYMLFLMAVPSAPKNMPFGNPKVIALTGERLQVNLKGPGKNYLLMVLMGEYRAYDDDYVAERAQDPTYMAYQKDALLRLARQKTKDELADRVGVETFCEEIRTVLNPLLFPIHIGDSEDPRGQDEESGLRPGESIGESTMREGYWSHSLQVDARRRTIALDDGTTVEFEGDETDLPVEDGSGHTVYVDVTGLNPDFAGNVHIGTFGTIRRVLFDDFVVQ